MKIIITGAGSFVAYHLTIKLLEKGHEILGIDKQRNKNIEELLAFSNFTFQRVDIAENHNLSQLCENVDVVYHLAAISSERLCRENPVLAVRVNVLGTLNMLEIAKKNNALFIFSSSGSVYPDSKHPKKEQEAAFTDKFYGTSKLIAEKYCALYHENFNLPFVILRFSRIYGPRMTRNPVYDMVSGLARKQPIKLYESLFSNYDFIYVEDVVKAFHQVLCGKWKNKIVNVSSNEAVRLQKIYDILMEISGSKLPVKVVVDKKSKDILDNEMAKKLGFKTDYSLEEGLRETYLYFKNR